MQNFPKLPDNHRLHVRHFHNGNDPSGLKRQRILIDELGFFPTSKPRAYVTLAQVVHAVDSKQKIVLAKGVSVCYRDSPNRKRGGQIAARRALKDFFYGTDNK